jgi:hypothetical protein
MTPQKMVQLTRISLTEFKSFDDVARPGFLSLRLDVYSPSQVLQVHGTPSSFSSLPSLPSLILESDEGATNHQRSMSRARDRRSHQTPSQLSLWIYGRRRGTECEAFRGTAAHNSTGSTTAIELHINEMQPSTTHPFFERGLISKSCLSH